MIRTCTECETVFDDACKQKKLAGGRITHCPDCSDEHVVRYLGVASGDGKMASVTILSFSDSSQREAYKSFWQNNSGLHRARSCQLGQHLSTTPSIKFTTITQTGAMNHKGRL